MTFISLFIYSILFLRKIKFPKQPIIYLKDPIECHHHRPETITFPPPPYQYFNTSQIFQNVTILMDDGDSLHLHISKTPNT